MKSSKKEDFVNLNYDYEKNCFNKFHKKRICELEKI